MLTVVDGQAQEVESLKGLIGWFNHNSVELIDEYRRLEQRVETLKAELTAKNEELEQSLQAREKDRIDLRSVLESVKGGVLALDQNLRPTFTNCRLTELTGEIDDQRVLQLLGERLAGNLLQGEKDFLPLECEKVVQGSTGAMSPVHFTLAEVGVGQDRSHYVLVFQDITILKRLEAEAACITSDLTTP